jgi:ABC-type Na+ efflux pump permease subunit
MSRKSKKKQAEEQIQAQSAIEPDSEPVPPAPDSWPTPEPVQAPSQEQQPVEVVATAGQSAASPAVTSLADDELPPPPADLAEATKRFPPIKTRKPGVGAGLKLAGAIFGKDVRTIAKHGLVSSVILLVFLMVIFYIASYSMFMFASTGFGEKGNGGDGNKTSGDGGPDLGNDGSLVAIAGSDQTVLAGSLVTLDSSGTEHTADIVFVQWSIENHNKSGWGDSPSLYGPTAQYTFYEVGTFTVRLMVVDARWNLAEANFTATVNPRTNDTTAPVIVFNGTDPNNVTYGKSVFFDASNSTDNDALGVVNWTWKIQDVVDNTTYEPKLHYSFMSTGNKQIMLVIRDYSGHTTTIDQSINVKPRDPSDNNWPNARMSDLPQSVKVGDTVTLDASASSDDRGITEYAWYVQLNNTHRWLTGQTTSFVAGGFGSYEITLVVKDNAGNAGTDQKSVMALSAGMKEPSMVSWTSTPLGQDIPFNVLTFAYGASLLASVIFLGGLFAKGFAHEIQKGTAKTLFFAPLSVTNMVFAKLLYPLIIGPLFIFPLLMISLMPLQQDPMQVLEIGAVSYVFTALVLISAAYGSCMIYAATKRMSVKPTVVSRSFMYLSLVGTLSVFAGLAYLLDQWLSTDSWNKMSEELGSKIAMFSPFHQGGLVLQNLLFGAPLRLDWIVFIIPAVLIVGGILASRKLYSDIFSRE